MPRGRGNRALSYALITTSLVLPTATLIPFGSLWLWEHGYLLHWAVGALTIALSVLGLEWWLLRPELTEEPPDTLASAETGEMLSSRELEAWKAVQAYAESLTPAIVSGENAIRNLARDTVNVVAFQLHPGEKNPIWNFTVPEALMLAERVAARLRPVVLDNIPLGDQLTVRQFLKLYQWRVAVDWAERAYDIWRIMRLINPAAAITHEARERLTRKMYASLRDEFTVRLAQGYVREVGRAAIELYGGKLRTTTIPATETPPMPATQSGWRLGRLVRQARNLGGAGASWILRRRRN